MSGTGMKPHELARYLEECRALVLQQISETIPRGGRYRPVLYDLVLDYPLREGKALRPALCIAACRALGGRLESVLPSAMVLELYHNAFLIHDDVEDGSEQRRGAETLHRMHGVPIAVNVGDAMLAMTLEPLLDNIQVLGLGKALRVLRTIARMARESAEGQALELDWIRRGVWDLGDADYVRMVYKKTGWYTFIAPLLVGAIAAGANGDQLARLRRFGAVLGVAFQIQDDILNLTSGEGGYGKEICGDLWEGKRTLILLHALRCAGDTERREALAALGRDRGNGIDVSATTETDVGSAKSIRDVEFLRGLIERCGSIAYANTVAARWATRAGDFLDGMGGWLEPSTHRGFLEALVGYVVARDR